MKQKGKIKKHPPLVPDKLRVVKVLSSMLLVFFTISALIFLVSSKSMDDFIEFSLMSIMAFIIFGGASFIYIYFAPIFNRDQRSKRDE
jgi:hypothetical protein